MQHKSWITNYEHEFERLAEEIGDLRYDSLAEFLTLLAQKIGHDGTKDEERGRQQLAQQLYTVQENVAAAAEAAASAWTICAPFMLPTDINAKLKEDFPVLEEQRIALQRLLDFNRFSPDRSTFRLERCILFAAGGDLPKLQQNIRIAQQDYRDIIMEAEYEGTERVRDLNTPFGSAERYSAPDEYPGPPDDLPF